MRLRVSTLVAPILSAIVYGSTSVRADPSAGGGGGELYPPGYLPLVNRANAFLTAGQFSDAAKAYTEAIGMVLARVHRHVRSC